MLLRLARLCIQNLQLRAVRAASMMLPEAKVGTINVRSTREGPFEGGAGVRCSRRQGVMTPDV